MKITYTNVGPDVRKAVEVEFSHQVAKLDKLLSHYAPDLVELHASIEKTPRRNEFNFALNLALPTGALHATGVGADILGSAKAAFAEIDTQVKKHQQKLRKDYVWKRKRGRGVPKLSEIPSAD